MQDSIKGHAPQGSTLKIETVVDPRLIGGLTASIGEKYFDLSLMSQIKSTAMLSAALRTTLSPRADETVYTVNARGGPSSRWFRAGQLCSFSFEDFQYYNLGKHSTIR